MSDCARLCRNFLSGKPSQDEPTPELLNPTRDERGSREPAAHTSAEDGHQNKPDEVPHTTAGEFSTSSLLRL